MVTSNGSFEALKERAAQKVCVKCNQRPAVAHAASGHFLRCGCYPHEPSLVDAATHQQKALARQYAENIAAPNPEVQHVATDALRTLYPKATEREIYIFQRLCIALGANPFLGEAHLVKYDDHSPAAFVPGYQIYVKRGAAHPSFAGFQSGIILEREGKLEYREGSFHLPKESLVGGWAKVYRADRQVPTTETVALAEFDKHHSQWKERPAYMIEKVAISHAFRRAFPDEMAALEATAEAAGSTVVYDDAPPAIEAPLFDKTDLFGGAA